MGACVRVCACACACRAGRGGGGGEVDGRISPALRTNQITKL